MQVEHLLFILSAAIRCQANVHDCPGGESCTHTCLTSSGCKNTILNCAADHACIFDVNGYNAKDSEIYAENASSLQIIDCNTCEITIHCPENGEDDTCQLEIISSTSGVTIYTQESFYDFQLISQGGATLESSTLYCGLNHDYSCEIESDGSNCISSSSSPCKDGYRLSPDAPTNDPTVVPTSNPTESPSSIPTSDPTMIPTTAAPTTNPTANPTGTSSAMPTSDPSAVPTMNPSAVPTRIPSEPLTDDPTIVPSDQPSISPTTSEPTKRPNAALLAGQTRDPTIPPENIVGDSEPVTSEISDSASSKGNKLDDSSLIVIAAICVFIGICIGLFTGCIFYRRNANKIMKNEINNINIGETKVVETVGDNKDETDGDKNTIGIDLERINSISEENNGDDRDQLDQIAKFEGVEEISKDSDGMYDGMSDDYGTQSVEMRSNETKGGDHVTPMGINEMNQQNMTRTNTENLKTDNVDDNDDEDEESSHDSDGMYDTNIKTNGSV